MDGTWGPRIFQCIAPKIRKTPGFFLGCLPSIQTRGLNKITDSNTWKGIAKITAPGDGTGSSAEMSQRSWEGVGLGESLFHTETPAAGSPAQSSVPGLDPVAHPPPPVKLPSTGPGGNCPGPPRQLETTSDWVAAAEPREKAPPRQSPLWCTTCLATNQPTLPNQPARALAPGSVPQWQGARQIWWQ